MELPLRHYHCHSYCLAKHLRKVPCWKLGLPGFMLLQNASKLFRFVMICGNCFQKKDAEKSPKDLVCLILLMVNPLFEVVHWVLCRNSSFHHLFIIFSQSHIMPSRGRQGLAARQVRLRCGRRDLDPFGAGGGGPDPASARCLCGAWNSREGPWGAGRSQISLQEASTSSVAWTSRFVEVEAPPYPSVTEKAIWYVTDLLQKIAEVTISDVFSASMASELDWQTCRTAEGIRTRCVAVTQLKPKRPSLAWTLPPRWLKPYLNFSIGLVRLLLFSDARCWKHF